MCVKHGARVGWRARAGGGLPHTHERGGQTHTHAGARALPKLPFPNTFSSVKSRMSTLRSVAGVRGVACAAAGDEDACDSGLRSHSEDKGARGSTCGAGGTGTGRQGSVGARMGGRPRARQPHAPQATTAVRRRTAVTIQEGPPAGGGGTRGDAHTRHTGRMPNAECSPHSRSPGPAGTRGTRGTCTRARLWPAGAAGGRRGGWAGSSHAE